ncbi:hypothetical protein HPB47_001030 [Ixodes persulcatus]|uniref:Uncharacterized protein n=1 Tax=Ixodes persulcatus TaxID=34615 RepID=A0AC60PRM0_IXOPE|nr:hypothetical protein HPB47_001030 [Ixodes persulcatus]
MRNARCRRSAVGLFVALAEVAARDKRELLAAKARRKAPIVVFEDPETPSHPVSDNSVATAEVLRRYAVTFPMGYPLHCQQFPEDTDWRSPAVAMVLTIGGPTAHRRCYVPQLLRGRQTRSGGSLARRCGGPGPLGISLVRAKAPPVRVFARFEAGAADSRLTLLAAP